MSYWGRRIQKEHDALYDAALEQMKRLYADAYRKALHDTQRDIEQLYDKLIKESADGKIRPNDIYRYNRYFELQSRLNQRLDELGGKEVKITDQKLLDMYQKTSNMIASEGKSLFGVEMVLDNPDAARKAINAIWCSDGKNWSTRIWNNKSDLQQNIQKGLMDSIVRGLSKDAIVEMLIGQFNVAFYQADRIARTELTYVQNRSAADRYIANGIKQYEYLAEIDSRTSSICKEHNGKIYSFTEMKVGENCPPLHPNCRSTIIPVIE